MLGNVEAGGSAVSSLTALGGPQSAVACVIWHHAREKDDKSSLMFLTVTNISVRNTCSSLLCLAFVVYSNAVNYRMDLEFLGHIRDSRIKWKTRYGRLRSSREITAPVEGHDQANTAQSIC